MAGLGFKDFQVGEVLTSSDVDGYLMQQSVMRFADSGARGSALGTAVGTAVPLAEGMLSYLADSDAVEVYDGSAWTPVGGIRQVVSTTKTDTYSAALAVGGTADPTGLSVTITPSSSSNKILVLAQVSGATSNNYGILYVVLRRDSTDLGIGDAASSRPRLTNTSRIDGGDNANLVTASVNYLDTPATTSAVTYQIRLLNPGNSSRTVYLNRSSADTDSILGARTSSTITAIEVAG